IRAFIFPYRLISAKDEGARQKYTSAPAITRDSPDESQTGINVRVFPALLQDRREVLTATSASGNPNAWSRVCSGRFPLPLDAPLLSVALKCMTSYVSR